ncbi:MAG: hypothetical protein ACKOA1_02670, partial [Bacteroidota bacterium]
MHYKGLFTLLISITGFLSAVVGFAQVTAAWKLDLKNSLNSANKACSMVADGSGGFYLLASTWVADSTRDLLLVRIDTNGMELWKRIYDRGKHLDEQPIAISADTAGNAWICATTKTDYGDADILVLKYSLDGALLNEDQFGMVSGTFDAPTSIIVDKSGSAYVSGYVTSLDSGLNGLLSRYTPSGRLQWYRTYSTVEMDMANDLVADDSCNVYSTGIVNASPHTSDLLICKYDSSGVLVWAREVDGIKSDNDGGSRIIADDSSRFVVTGFMNRSGDRSDVPVILIDSSGEIIRQQLFVGGTADCSIRDVVFHKNVLTMVIRYTDYGLEKHGSYMVEYSDGLVQLFFRESAAGEDCFALLNSSDRIMSVSTVVVPEEGTLRPGFFIPSEDSLPGFAWTDDSVNGLVFVRKVLITDNAVYYFGDD